MKTYLPLVALLLGLAVVAAQCASASPAQPQNSNPDLMIMEPYARATIPNGAVYMKLVNQGGTDDVLLSAASDMASAVELHESKLDENGVMKMGPVPNIPVPAGGSATLEPGGLHVMLIGLKKELAVGDKFNLTLNFEKSGPKTIEVEVRDSMMGQDQGQMDSMTGGEGEMEGMQPK